MTARKASWAEALIVGVLVFGAIGTGSFLALLAGLFAYIRTDQSLWSGMAHGFVPCAMAAASVVGALAWRFVAEPGAHARRQGAAAGLIVGTVSHPLCWALYSAYAVSLNRAQFPEVIPAAVFVFVATIFATFSSLLTLGWLSAPICALLGFFTADVRFQCARHES